MDSQTSFLEVTEKSILAIGLGLNYHFSVDFFNAKGNLPTFVNMGDIQHREDVYTLVCVFYEKIRKDDLLGPIFNNRIPEEEWPAHLQKLTDFWESNLFSVYTFRGSPSAKHISVDRDNNHQIESRHFGHWLNLWVATVDGMFEGEKATRAKMKARKMATGQFLTIWKAREEKD